MVVSVGESVIVTQGGSRGPIYLAHDDDIETTPNKTCEYRAPKIGRCGTLSVHGREGMVGQEEPPHIDQPPIIGVTSPNMTRRIDPSKSHG